MAKKQASHTVGTHRVNTFGKIKLFSQAFFMRNILPEEAQFDALKSFLQQNQLHR